MRILLNLAGVILATAFLMFMAIRLNEPPLYAVCLIGVALMVFGFWQDEIRDLRKASNGNGNG